MADANVASDASLTVTTAATGKNLSFDGSAETDGTFNITGAERGHNNLTGGAGDDTISGADHADTLIGGAGDDVLNGLSGADKLVGGLGSDTMSGDIGQDRFFYLSAEDSTAAAPDLIEKFGQNDILYLRPVDADTTKVGNQTFQLVEAFSGHAGELTVGLDRSLHVTVISCDVDGDGLADLVIYLDSKHPDGLVL
jgi:Ca2+-binding RTX toxin-like protein